MPIGKKIKAVLSGSGPKPAVPLPYSPDPDFPRNTHPEAARAEDRIAALRPYLTHGGTGAEIGVFWAHLSECILRETAPRKLILADPWDLAHGPTYRAGVPYKTNKGKLTTAETYSAALALRDTNPRVVEVEKALPLDFLASLPDAVLDWAYLDTDATYTGLRAILQALLPKMKPTGVIAGDDYSWDPSDQRFDIKMAVDEFVAKYGLEFIGLDHYQFVLLQGQSPRPS